MEAPEVVLEMGATLDARGGAGGSCVPNTFNNCYPGGAGATASAGATSGTNASCGADNKPNAAGGGGGGLGRIRINTKDGSYTKASTTVEYGALTAGTIETR